MSLKLIENLQDTYRAEIIIGLAEGSRGECARAFYATGQCRRALQRRLWLLYGLIVVAFMVGLAL